MSCLHAYNRTIVSVRSTCNPYEVEDEISVVYNMVEQPTDYRKMLGFYLSSKFINLF